MKRKTKRPRAAHRDAPWTEFVQCNALYRNGERISMPEGILYFRNNHYQVDVHALLSKPFGKVIWLSIKRNDRSPVHDWRDFQRIKNELVGPEFEAIELYPAESRLVDSANQYHLWVLVEFGMIPLGYTERLVVDPDFDGDCEELKGSDQRPFRGHERPADVMSPKELVAKYADDPTFATRLAHAMEDDDAKDED